ncbi:MAG TPA: hypothetical protein VNO51_18830 [Ilumatobacteraceae bacterium]|nr:hypothetical protein [Ilumatobacteraceae bacterium]
MRKTRTDRERLLGLYLDDHRAGAAGGVALARRMLKENSDNYLTATMRELTVEIERDRQVLDDVIGRLRHSPNRIKMVMGAAGAWLARLKANGYVRQYSPLSRLEEFEMLSAGLLSKASLWRSCQLSLGGRPELAGLDFDALCQRADNQRAKLETHRSRIVDDAFGSSVRER